MTGPQHGDVPTPGPGGTQPLEHVVAEGDTLSAIALQHYGDGSEESWQRIYDANKDTIGEDPDLIKPGQTLVIPPKPAQTA